MPSCFHWSAQKGTLLNPSSGQSRCDPETFKLKNSRAPLYPPLPNRRVALRPQLSTETVLRGLKRLSNPQARQAHPLKLKLTHGALTTLVAGLVSGARWDWSQFACRCSCLPPCMENVLESMFEGMETPSKAVCTGRPWRRASWDESSRASVPSPQSSRCLSRLIVFFPNWKRCPVLWV